MDPLQKLISDRMAELDLSFRRAAERGGGLVSHATLNNITLGRHSTQFEDDTLRGIALALDLPLSQVREAASVSREPPTEFRLPKKANRLTHADRAAILKVVDALLDAHQQD